MSDPGATGPVDPDDPTITDGYGRGEAADVGNQDPITGLPGGDDNADLDSRAQLPDRIPADEDVPPSDDPEAVREESLQTVTDDAVAGDTVHGGIGESNQGPTGGAPREFEPSPSDPVYEGLPENELQGEDIDLDDENRTLDR
jgi:hypothetical protein